MEDRIEKLQSEFTILKKMDESVISQQKYRVFLASGSDEVPVFLSIKEIDAKRAEVYRKLCGRWHPNLASVYEVKDLDPENPEESKGEAAGQDTESPSHIAIMEYVPGVSLQDYVTERGTLSPEEALDIAHQLAEGLSFLHKYGVIHKDIKPENVIMTDSLDNKGKTARIIDLGISELYDPMKLYPTEIGGTRGYRAPEVANHVATYESDIFSLGCVLNFMLCGNDPYIQDYQGDHELEHIIEKSIAWDSSQRYGSMQEFIKAVEHAQKRHLLDRIPVIRRIPGYRSHTFTKMLPASIYYGYQAFLTMFYCLKRDYLLAMVSAMCYVLLPWILCFDLLNLAHFLPVRLRSNGKVIWQLQILLLIVCITVPFLFGAGLFGSGALLEIWGLLKNYFLIKG